MKRILPILAVLALAGCAETRSHQGTVVMDDVSAEMMRKGVVEEPPAFNYASRSLSGGEPYRDVRADGLPADMAARQGALVTLRPVSAQEAVRLLGEGFKLPVQWQAAQTCGQGVGPSGQSPVVPVVPVGNTPPLPGAVNAVGVGGASSGEALNFRGDLGAVVKGLEALYDMKAQWNGSQLVFAETATETFRLRVTNLKGSFSSASLNRGGGGQGRGGTGGQSNSGSSGGGTMSGGDVNLWDELMGGIRQIAGPNACLHEMPGLGTIVVTDRPSVRERVRSFLRPINAVVGRQIVVETTLIKVDVSDNSSFGLNLDLLFKQGDTNVRFFGSTPGLSAGGAASISLLPASLGGASHFAGSSLIQRLATEQNRLADVRNSKNIVTNAVPIEVDLSTTKRFLGNVDLGTPGGSSNSLISTAQTETVDVGFLLRLLPRVIAPNEIGLAVSISDSAVTNKSTRLVGQTEVDLFDIQHINTGTNINMMSGQTLVIAGMEQVIQQSGRQTQLFGFSRAGGESKVRVILLITPTILPEGGEGQ